MGVELPNAFFTIGRLHFTLKEFYKSLEAYLEAIQYCSTQEESFYVELLEEEIQFIRNSGFEDSLKDRCDWIIQTLLIGKVVIVKDKTAIKALERTSIKRNLEKPVLIFAGGTTGEVKKEVERYEPYLNAPRMYKEIFCGSLMRFTNGMMTKLGVLRAILPLT